MQNTVRWRSYQFQPTHIWNPWSNETDANLEDSACTVRVLLFFPIAKILIFIAELLPTRFEFENDFPNVHIIFSGLASQEAVDSILPAPEEQNTLPTPLEQGILPSPVDQNILPTPVEQPTLPTPVQSCPDLSSPGGQDLFPSPTQQLMNQNSPQANYPNLPPTPGNLPTFQETLPQVHEKLPPIQGKLPSIQEFMNPDPVMPRQQHSGKQQLLQNSSPAMQQNTSPPVQSPVVLPVQHR